MNYVFVKLITLNLFLGQLKLPSNIESLLGLLELEKLEKLLPPSHNYLAIRVLHETIQKQPPEVFLRKGILKIYSIFTREHSCLSAISIKLQYNFIEITLNFLHIFRTPLLKNTSGRLLLTIVPFLFISQRYD